jgi:hypothetical protein
MLGIQLRMVIDLNPPLGIWHTPGHKPQNGSWDATLRERHPDPDGTPARSNPGHLAS